MNQYAIIILAAGSSSRLGYPKQLVVHKQESLIVHALSEATKVSSTVLVVLGAHAESVTSEILDKPVQRIYNSQWEEGIASSIRCGLAHLLDKDPSLVGVILMVCDQPFVDSTLLSKLITTHEKTNKPIIASAYQGVMGTPVLFHKSFFPCLLEIKGQVGAKQIITQHEESVASITFPLGFVDIDTKQDHDNLKNNQIYN